MKVKPGLIKIFSVKKHIFGKGLYTAYLQSLRNVITKVGDNSLCKRLRKRFRKKKLKYPQNQHLGWNNLIKVFLALGFQFLLGNTLLTFQLSLRTMPNQIVY